MYTRNESFAALARSNPNVLRTIHSIVVRHSLGLPLAPIETRARGSVTGNPTTSDLEISVLYKTSTQLRWTQEDEADFMEVKREVYVYSEFEKEELANNVVVQRVMCKFPTCMRYDCDDPAHKETTNEFPVRMSSIFD